MKEIKTGSDHLNKYEKEVRKKKASACLKEALSGKKMKKYDIKNKFLATFSKAAEKVSK